MANNRKAMIEAIGEFRAAGSLLVAAVKKMMAEVPDATEGEMLAAEKYALVNTPLAPPIGGTSPGPTPDPTIDVLLAGARVLGGQRVDPVVPPGTAGTVTLAKTGHVLSLPLVSTGEMFAGYAGRVCDQATEGKAEQYRPTIGMLFQGTGHVFAPFGGYKADGSNWPQAADFFFNMAEYTGTAPKPVTKEIAETYRTAAELKSAAEFFPATITLDGVTLWPGKFGPGLSYVSNPDKSVKRG